MICQLFCIVKIQIMLKYHFFAVLGILFRYFFVPLPMVLKAENGLERKEMPLNAIFG